MTEKFTGIYFDYVGIGPEGFGFGIGSDSPNELLAQKVDKMVSNNKPFRLKVVGVEEIESQ